MQIVAVPQRQGAVNQRAGRLPQGCLALAALASRTLGIRVDHVALNDETSPIERGVANRRVLTGSNLAAQRTAVETATGPVLTIGGDCGVELEPVRAARRRYGAGLALAWFDAHADLNTPESSPSGAFHGMVLRALLGEGDPLLIADPAVAGNRVALVGVRAMDRAEQVYLDQGSVRVATEDAAAVLRGAPHLYVHVDVDVLDPVEFEGSNYPETGGLSIAELVQALDGLAGFEVIGAGITECVGTAPQVEVLAPIIAALGRLLMPPSGQG